MKEYTLYIKVTVCVLYVFLVIVFCRNILYKRIQFTYCSVLDVYCIYSKFTLYKWSCQLIRIQILLQPCWDTETLSTSNISSIGWILDTEEGWRIDPIFLIHSLTSQNIQVIFIYSRISGSTILTGNSILKFELNRCVYII